MTTEEVKGKYGRAIHLECCCCGGGTYGRQWWNRDTGYGMCDNCISYVRSRSMSEEEIERNYGKAGIHHSLPE